MVINHFSWLVRTTPALLRPFTHHLVGKIVICKPSYTNMNTIHLEPNSAHLFLVSKKKRQFIKIKSFPKKRVSRDAGSKLQFHLIPWQCYCCSSLYFQPSQVAQRLTQSSILLFGRTACISSTRVRLEQLNVVVLCQCLAVAGKCIITSQDGNNP